MREDSVQQLSDEITEHLRAAASIPNLRTAQDSTACVLSQSKVEPAWPGADHVLITSMKCDTRSAMVARKGHHKFKLFIGFTPVPGPSEAVTVSTAEDIAPHNESAEAIT